MLELGLRRGKHDGELAEDLGVRVKRVARGAPRLVGELRPVGGHVWKLQTEWRRLLDQLLDPIGLGAPRGFDRDGLTEGPVPEGPPHR